jgi:SAM-dependent methyltransferase
VPAHDWVTPEDERARYAHHDNTESNPGYVRFLNEVADIAAGLAKPAARILDFGAGENAVLTHLLRRRGFDCNAYDPLYGVGTTALSDRYDVVILCEVIEHLRNLRDEVVSLGKALAPDGHIVVRTQCYPSVQQIPSWWYARDITHINFFAPQTLASAAGLCGLRCRPSERPDLVVWTR